MENPRGEFISPYQKTWGNSTYRHLLRRSAETLRSKQKNFQPFMLKCEIVGLSLLSHKDLQSSHK